jgi:hypothetical protein
MLVLMILPTPPRTSISPKLVSPALVVPQLRSSSIHSTQSSLPAFPPLTTTNTSSNLRLNYIVSSKNRPRGKSRTKKMAWIIETRTSTRERSRMDKIDKMSPITKTLVDKNENRHTWSVEIPGIPPFFRIPPSIQSLTLTG